MYATESILITPAECECSPDTCEECMEEVLARCGGCEEARNCSICVSESRDVESGEVPLFKVRGHQRKHKHNHKIVGHCPHFHAGRKRQLGGDHQSNMVAMEDVFASGTPDAQDRDNTIRVAIMIILTGSFMVVELVVGLATGSLALVADSFHMMSDVGALIVGLITIRVAVKEKKREKLVDLSWVRVEAFGGLVNACTLLALTFFIVLEAIVKFIEEPDIDNPILILVVGGIGLAINIFGIFLFWKRGHGHSHGGGGHSHGGHGHSHGGGHGHAHNSKGAESEAEQQETDTHGEGQGRSNMNLHGVFLHVMGDALGSIAVIVSAIIMWQLEWYYVDPILSLVIALIICISTIPLAIRTSRALLGLIPSSVNLDAIESGFEQLAEEGVNVKNYNVFGFMEGAVVAWCLVEFDDPTNMGPAIEKVSRILWLNGVQFCTVQPVLDSTSLDSENESHVLLQLSAVKPRQSRVFRRNRLATIVEVEMDHVGKEMSTDEESGENKGEI